jgi:predicted MFS family arabinose efflux permease
MPHRQLITAAYLAAATFGAFWGTWGAAVPRVRDQSGLDDAGLGTALLFISAGALPAMLLTGRALDRWGLRGTAPLMVALGGAGVATALSAGDLVSLAAGLTAVGFTSGAADVAMNSVAGRAEQRSGRPIITRAGAAFSAAVVAASLGTGAAYALQAPTWAPFAAVLLLSAATGAAIHRSLPTGVSGPEPAAPDGTPGARLAPDGLAGAGHAPHGPAGAGHAPHGPAGAGHAPHGPAGAGHAPNGPAGSRLPLAPLLLLGTLGALAFASENAHQSWSAVFLEDILNTGPGFSAIAPALFAGVVAITRFAASTLSPTHARKLLLAGALVAAAGAALLARAPSLPAGLAGLVLAAAGTAALFPTLLSIVSRNVTESARGRATSIVTVVSYLGFLLGPVYVGLWAAATGLRGAMIAVAALGAALAALTLPLLSLSRYAVSPPRDHISGRARQPESLDSRHDQHDRQHDEREPERPPNPIHRLTEPNQ